MTGAERSIVAAGTRVLITGATAGLGAAMAARLGRDGARLALTGRRADRLADAARVAREAGAAETLELVGPVEDPATVAGHAAAIDARFGGLDVAILNAGVGLSFDGRVTYDASRIRRALEVNTVGVAQWIEAVLPGMRTAGAGTIAGVSSPAGWRGFPTIAPYAASKAALTTLLESLRIELRGTGIRVVTVCPGFVRSEMTAGNDPRAMPGLLETADGAERMLRGIAAGRRLVHFPRRFTLPLALFCRLAPGAIADRVLARIADRQRP